MAYKSLRDFIEQLEADGDLVRVTRPVSTHLEMTEIQRRLLAKGGPAVLFENPVHEDGRPSEMPALVNLFGTVERVARAVTLGGEPRRAAFAMRSTCCRSPGL
jgi:4-hydroxy-3-polyprenylbenzoate decarboxylase